MENRLEQKNAKQVLVDKLDIGSTIIGIEAINNWITIDSHSKFFLAKYGFYGIKLRRGERDLVLNGDQLELNDRVEHLGLLRWPLKISSSHQLKLLKGLGVREVSILERKKSQQETYNSNEDDFFTVDAVPVKKNLDITRVSKKVSKLLAELHKIQDNVEEAVAIQETGYELLSDVFKQGNIQPIAVKGIENLVSRIYSHSSHNSRASQVMMTLKDHDEYTFRHCVDVTNQLVFILKYMGSYNASDLQKITVAALLHDIGKYKIPLHVLNKPGKLSEQEWEMMKMHPVYSAEVMKSMNLSPMQVEIGHLHHLRKNGSGYPSGYEYENTHEAVRLLMIVDVYQALVTLRPYRKPDTPYAAITKMQSWAGTLFDSWLMDTFVKAFGLYPIGSFVRLNDFRYGFVVSNDRHTLRPVVMVCFDKAKNAMSKLEIIDLADQENNMLEVGLVVDHREFFANNEALDFFMNLDI